LNFLYSYRFTIGGVDYADLDMARDEDIEDACGTMVSEIRPPRSRRPRFHDEYDCGDNCNFSRLMSSFLSHYLS